MASGALPVPGTDHGAGSEASPPTGPGPLMVFHAPYPLVERAAASRLRPVRMLRAFRDLGVEVLVVAGYAAARRRAMARAQERIDRYLAQRSADLAAGRRAGPMPFVYSENATIPNALTEPRHLPPHPHLDAAFFTRMRRRGLGVGVFYRDLYWRFPRFRRGINPVIDRSLAVAYTAELRSWNRAGLHLYLPSAAMAEHVPVFRPEDTSALPPGADPQAVRSPSRPDPGGLELLFVGVLGDNYRMDAVFEALKTLAPAAEQGPAGRVRLTLCVRPDGLPAAVGRDGAAHSHVEVVHASGGGLEPLYARSSLGLLMVEPHEYWDFAVPYKLYEYLAHELPVIATEGTEAGRIVAELGIGWVLPYDPAALAGLLRHLAAHPGQLEERRRRMRRVLPDQTWHARARTVVGDLSPASLRFLIETEPAGRGDAGKESA